MHPEKRSILKTHRGRVPPYRGVHAILPHLAASGHDVSPHLTRASLRHDFFSDASRASRLDPTPRGGGSTHFAPRDDPREDSLSFRDQLHARALIPFPLELALLTVPRAGRRRHARASLSSRTLTPLGPRASSFATIPTPPLPPPRSCAPRSTPRRTCAWTPSETLRQPHQGPSPKHPPVGRGRSPRPPRPRRRRPDTHRTRRLRHRPRRHPRVLPRPRVQPPSGHLLASRTLRSAPRRLARERRPLSVRRRRFLRRRRRRVARRPGGRRAADISRSGAPEKDEEVGPDATTSTSAFAPRSAPAPFPFAPPDASNLWVEPAGAEWGARTYTSSIFAGWRPSAIPCSVTARRACARTPGTPLDFDAVGARRRRHIACCGDSALSPLARRGGGPRARSRGASLRRDVDARDGDGCGVRVPPPGNSNRGGGVADDDDGDGEFRSSWTRRELRGGVRRASVRRLRRYPGRGSRGVGGETRARIGRAPMAHRSDVRRTRRRRLWRESHRRAFASVSTSPRRDLRRHADGRTSPRWRTEHSSAERHGRRGSVERAGRVRISGGVRRRDQRRGEAKLDFSTRA